MRRPGVDRTRRSQAELAALAAQVAMAAFGHAATAWFDDPKPGLRAHLERAFQRLRDLTPPAPQDPIPTSTAS